MSHPCLQRYYPCRGRGGRATAHAANEVDQSGVFRAALVPAALFGALGLVSYGPFTKEGHNRLDVVEVRRRSSLLYSTRGSLISLPEGRHGWHSLGTFLQRHSLRLGEAFQVAQQVGGARVALLRILGQHLAHDLLEEFRDVHSLLPQRRGLVAVHLGQ